MPHTSQHNGKRLIVTSEHERRSIIRNNERVRLRSLESTMLPHEWHRRNERLMLAKDGRDAFARGEWVMAASKRQMHPIDQPFVKIERFDWSEE
jgi:hypothetical protein